MRTRAEELIDTWKLDKGASPLPDGSVSFNVWAPHAKKLTLKLLDDSQRTFKMRRLERDEYEIIVPDVKPGTDYLYIIDDLKERPDPVSRHQPKGVHGPSRVVDPDSFCWEDEEWKGFPLQDSINYELHVGAFTPKGTFEAIIKKLPYLKDLGITTLSLMPVTQCPGNRNWGYDGTHLYAPSHYYGGPDGLKKLINACHLQGMAVILDAVYNHFGPEGCYLQDFGPYFTDAYHTPWGDAINFDGNHSDTVRKYMIDNALYWLMEYHVDGLRLDAVHAIRDFSPCHLLKELSEKFHSQAEALNRTAWLIAESSLNDPKVLHSREMNGYGLDAQWNDDFHHAIYTLVTGNQREYLSDYGTFEDLQKAVEEGYVYDGRWSEYQNKTVGLSSKHIDGSQMIAFIQNHDQIANTCHGKRLATLMTPQQHKLAVSILFMTPNIPLLFMGQEWGVTKPFHYFTEFSDQELIENVRKGYLNEFNLHDLIDEISDPQSEETFLKAKLDWTELNQATHQHNLNFYKDIIHLKKSHPCLNKCNKDTTQVQYDDEKNWFMISRWDDESESYIISVSNLSESQQNVPIIFPEGVWTIALKTSDSKYGEQEVESLNQIAGDGKQVFDILTAPWSSIIYEKESE